jgi:outer membrane protein assembly factor BamB
MGFKSSIIFIKVAFFMLLFVDSSDAQEVWSESVSNTVIFSSPRCVDLNNDDVLDVVVGDGVENQNFGQISAFDGEDGTPLWSTEVNGDIFGSALFYEIDNDGIPDIVIGGRSRQLHALSGADGELIWSFDENDSPPPDGWLQFYNPELVPDQNSDGLMDLVVTNGGTINALPGEGPRFPGYLVLVSSSDGSVLNKAIVPDSAETYCSPVVADIENDGEIDIVFGTGGETFPGSLWRTTLSSLIQNDISGAIELFENDTHGFVAAPVLADINVDQVLDVVSASAEGQVAVFNGLTNQLLWEFQLPITECYSTPAIGQFVGSNHLDVYANIGKGIWPQFEYYYQVMIDGQTGQVEYFDSIGNQFSSPLSYDFDSDGVDEALLSSNESSIFLPNTYQLIVVDFNDSDTAIIYELNNAVSGASTPWIGDVDADNSLDLFTPINVGQIGSGYSLKRLSTETTLTNPVKWGAYHGSNYNGVYDFIEYTPIGLFDDLGPAESFQTVFSEPLDKSRLFDQDGNKEIELYDLQGKLVFDSSNNKWSVGSCINTINTGVYLLRTKQIDNQVVTTRKVLIE